MHVPLLAVNSTLYEGQWKNGGCCPSLKWALSTYAALPIADSWWLTTEKSSNLKMGCNATTGLTDRQEVMNLSALYVSTLDKLLLRLCGGAVCYILP